MNELAISSFGKAVKRQIPSSPVGRNIDGYNVLYFTLGVIRPCVYCILS